MSVWQSVWCGGRTPSWHIWKSTNPEFYFLEREGKGGKEERILLWINALLRSDLNRKQYGNSRVFSDPALCAPAGRMPTLPFLLSAPARRGDVVANSRPAWIQKKEIFYIVLLYSIPRSIILQNRREECGLDPFPSQRCCRWSPQLDLCKRSCFSQSHCMNEGIHLSRSSFITPLIKQMCLTFRDSVSSWCLLVPKFWVSWRPHTDGPR